MIVVECEWQLCILHWKNIFEFRMKKLGLIFIEIQNVAITPFFYTSQRMGYTGKSR